MARLLYRLGLFAARRAKSVLAFWFAMLVLAATAFAYFGGQLTDQISMPDLETSEVADRLADELPDAGGGSVTAVVRSEDGSAITEEQREAVEDLIAEVESHDVIDEITDPWAAQEDLAEAEEELQKGRAELEDGQEQLDEAEAELDQAREQLDGLDREGLEEAQAEVDQAWDDAASHLRRPRSSARRWKPDWRSWMPPTPSWTHRWSRLWLMARGLSRRRS
ncbi:hypothetical protein [Nesterenkonia pannonica]|uniref:hypothetical protein n=1 Tax=Nesterenkonia pannonica TaxID=1548602 RepID=UPI002164C857|nr:hypothetical protein [Nesterenkonia pannonica]